MSVPGRVRWRCSHWTADVSCSPCVVLTQITVALAPRAASTTSSSRGTIACAALTSCPSFACGLSEWQKSFWTSTTTRAVVFGSIFSGSGRTRLWIIGLLLSIPEG